MSEKVEPYMDDERLIRSVLTVLHRPFKDQKHVGNTLWSNVGEVFGLGSTSAHKLCERFGFDPDIKVRKVFRADRN